MPGLDNNKKILVEFIRHGTDELIGSSEMPVENLPDTFAIETKFFIREEEWRVMAAKPVNKTEFRNAEKLQLFLEKNEVKFIPMEQILYTIPTISNDFPALINTTQLENVLVLHEDDWRQIEFIYGQSDLINYEMSRIDNIYENEKEEFGFNKIHIRDAIPLPLQNKTLTLSTLKTHFPETSTYSGVAFKNAAAVIKNGFAYKSGEEIVLWGQLDENQNIAFLNFLQLSKTESEPVNVLIDSFIQKEELYYVDWCRLYALQQPKIN